MRQTPLSWIRRPNLEDSPLIHAFPSTAISICPLAVTCPMQCTAKPADWYASWTSCSLFISTSSNKPSSSANKIASSSLWTLEEEDRSTCSFYSTSRSSVIEWGEVRDDAEVRYSVYFCSPDNVQRAAMTIRRRSQTRSWKFWQGKAWVHPWLLLLLAEHGLDLDNIYEMP